MSQNGNFDDRYTIINIVISSINDVVPVIRNGVLIDDHTKVSMNLILMFLNKVIEKLPVVLISEYDINAMNEDVVNCLDQTICSLLSPENCNEDFSNCWERFTEAWCKLYSAMNDIRSSGNTIYISMN